MRTKVIIYFGMAKFLYHLLTLFTANVEEHHAQ